MTKSKEPIAFGGPLCIYHTDTQYGPYLSLRLLSAVYPICNFRLFALALDSSITDQLRMVLVILFRLLSCLLTKRSRIWLLLLLLLATSFLELDAIICYIRSLHPFLTQQPSMFFYQVLFEVLFHVYFHVYSWCEARCICTICLVSG